MNGIRFGPDMGISQTRWTYTKNKNPYLNKEIVGMVNSTNNVNPVIPNETSQKPSKKFKPEKLFIDRRKYKRLSIRDYLNLEEQIIGFVPLNNDEIQEHYKNQNTLNKEKLLEKSTNTLLNKFEFASILSYLSEEIIAYARKIRDGDTLSGEQKVLENLVSQSNLTKLQLNSKILASNDNTIKNLEQQIKEIFQKQKQFDNKYANDIFENECFTYINLQKNFIQHHSHIHFNKAQFSSKDFFNSKIKLNK